MVKKVKVLTITRIALYNYNLNINNINNAKFINKTKIFKKNSNNIF